jgi:dynein heavy chain
MSTYVDVVEKTPMLTPLDRKKLTSLIILEEHHREIIDKLYGVKGIKREHFEWLSQCRFTLQDHDAGQESLFDVKIEQMNSCFLYGCEYMGNQQRLVITPLTDKAYMTLTSAMHMARGGAP